jgi:hypothetical protein
MTTGVGAFDKSNEPFRVSCGYNVAGRFGVGERLAIFALRYSLFFPLAARCSLLVGMVIVVMAAGIRARGDLIMNR